MLKLAEDWKDEALALAEKARYVQDSHTRKMMISRSEALLECANRLIAAYLTGVD